MTSKKRLILSYGILALLLAVLFAAFCALASFGIGNLSQLNSIAGNLKAAFGVPEAVTGAVLAAVSAVILLGGLKRVAAVAERLVPAMALLYIVGALTVVGVHITAVPAALAAIVKGAFGLRAAGGGMVGYGLSRAVTWGFKRGAFSNEAGLGSAAIAAACAESGREAGEITLVGASKMNDAAACREAIAAGIDVLGENRVQEMTEKLSQNAYDGAPLHFIGHLQRNKVKQVVGKVALIQSVGSLPLLEAVEKEAEKQERREIKEIAKRERKAATEES